MWKDRKTDSPGRDGGETSLLGLGPSAVLQVFSNSSMKSPNHYSSSRQNESILFRGICDPVQKLFIDNGWLSSLLALRPDAFCTRLDSQPASQPASLKADGKIIVPRVLQ